MSALQGRKSPSEDNDSSVAFMEFWSWNEDSKDAWISCQCPRLPSILYIHRETLTTCIQLLESGRQPTCVLDTLGGGVVETFSAEFEQSVLDAFCNLLLATWFISKLSSASQVLMNHPNLVLHSHTSVSGARPPSMIFESRTVTTHDNLRFRYRVSPILAGFRQGESKANVCRREAIVRLVIS
ncbi:uncharacterized protein ARMOST_22059 [Armillaria ostoyae]|uniref:Uncharacterized protein n=1 Tax=Armillaria ostoyae TaxID=47428 RepID=A0A284SBS7_ARMOS|nr:uncharacterized protein ARMOST_22059 [Armillaria ostoyae]